jgi:hypothetical protein
MTGRREALDAAKQMGPEGAEDPVQPCNNCPKTMLDMVNVCSCSVYEKAQAVSKAHTGHDLRIVDYPAKHNGLGYSNIDYGQINIYKGPDIDECTRAQILLFELYNVWQTPKFVDLKRRAAAGEVSREQFMDENERIEHRSGIFARGCVDQCNPKWCCAKKNMHSWIPDDYDEFRKKADPKHAEHQGSIWDSMYKDAYEKAHPKP